MSQLTFVRRWTTRAPQRGSRPVRSSPARVARSQDAGARAGHMSFEWLWIRLPPLGRSTDAFGAVMPELVQHPVVHRFPGSDLTELRGHVGILEELEQQYFRSLRSTKERYPPRSQGGAPRSWRSGGSCRAIEASTAALEAGCSASARRSDWSFPDFAFEGTSCSRTSPGVAGFRATASRTNEYGELPSQRSCSSVAESDFARSR